MTGDDVVAEARTWLGTPFHHQARLRGIGVDCLNVILGVGHALGLTQFEVQGYGRQPSGAQIEAGLKAECDPIPVSEMRDGDILLFRFDKDPQHLAFKTDVGILHALSKAGKVVETSFDKVWQKRLVSVHRFRGLD